MDTKCLTLIMMINKHKKKFFIDSIGSLFFLENLWYK